MGLGKCIPCFKHGLILGINSVVFAIFQMGNVQRLQCKSSRCHDCLVAGYTNFFMKGLNRVKDCERMGLTNQYTLSETNSKSLWKRGSFQGQAVSFTEGRLNKFSNIGHVSVVWYSWILWLAEPWFGSCFSKKDYPWYTSLSIAWKHPK